MHDLPVMSQKELWNAQTWSQKLGKKLALYHWSEPTRVLPKDHTTFTEDPKVNFASMQSSCASTLDLPSSTKIVDITDNDPPTDHEPEVEGKKTITFAQDVCKDALPPISSSVPELCHPPSVNSTLLTTDGIDTDLFALDDVQSSVQVLLDHALPLSKHRTNVVTEQYVPRGRLFGGYATRGQGITHSTYRFAEVVEATHLITKTRPKDFAQEPHLSAQANSARSFPLHKDKNNHSRTWPIAFGEYTGGRLWIESAVGVDPPPDPKSAWQKKLRGDYYDVRNKWLAFDPQLYHCVEEVTSGTRRSLQPLATSHLSDLKTHSRKFGLRSWHSHHWTRRTRTKRPPDKQATIFLGKSDGFENSSPSQQS